MLGRNTKLKIFCMMYFIFYTALLAVNFMGVDLPTPLMIFIFVVMAPFALIGMVGMVYELIRKMKLRREL